MGKMKDVFIEQQNFLRSLPFTPYDYQQKYLTELSQCNLTGKNYLITLPTGAGKSLGFEYVAHLGKTIYTVPIRELANEQLEQLPSRYPNLRVLRDTGQDYENRKGFDYVNQDVIITTNERLLSVMNTSIKSDFFKDVKFIVLDEIHMISNVSRGSTLEYIIMLLKRYHPDIIIVGLSATLPNYEEFAEWLDADYTYLPREARPVPLEFHFGRAIPRNLWKMKQKREYKFGQLVTFSYRFTEQFLVFMSSKRDIEHYARKFAGLGDSATLQRLMEKGVAYHHADISNQEKADVVAKFKSGDIRMIFCSPTLAVGVNLPATNCVVFDMSFWNDIAMEHEPQEADALEQMFGRAGRVGYSEVGRVIILGDEQELEIAKEHIANPMPTYSQFGRVLVDKVLNMIVKDIANTAVDIYSVIKESFLFFQQKQFDIKVIVDALDLLAQYNFISTEDNYTYKTTFRGRMTVNMYLKVHTMIDVLKGLINNRQLKSVYDVWRVLLSHEDFLGGVHYDGSGTDSTIVRRTKDAFRSKGNTMINIWVNLYDKHQNKHIPRKMNDEFNKLIGMMFKDEVIGKNFKLYTQESTLWKFRQDGAVFIKKLSEIFAAQLNERVSSPELLKDAELMLKYGTLNRDSVLLYKMGGLGEKSIQVLLNRGIKTPEEFFKTSLNRLKAYGIRMSEQRFNQLKKSYMGESTIQTSLGDW